MTPFSVVNLKSLDEISRNSFHKSLSNQLSLMDEKLQGSDSINYPAVKSYITKEGQLPEAFSTVDELYSNVTAGIQAGSGSQDILLTVLNAFNTSWNETQATIWKY